MVKVLAYYDWKKMETNQKFHLGSVVRLELDLIRVVNAKID